MSPLTIPMPEWIEAPVLAVGWALVLFLGQGLLIGLGVAALLRVCRDRSPDLRYALACAGLLMMTFCPIVTTIRGLESRRGETARTRTAESAPARIESHTEPTAEPGLVDGPPPARITTVGTMTVASTPETEVRPDWRAGIEARLPALVGAWLAGVGLLALRLVTGFAAVRDLTRRGTLPPTDALRAVVDELLERSGLRRPVRCVLSLRVDVPSVVGWLRPTILVPATSLARLTARQLEAMLAHEVAHIRRHDYLVNLIQVAVESLLFFHPAVWWVSRRIRAEREHCCDDMAVALCGGDRLLVARTLFTLEELRHPSDLRVAANGGSLRDRVRRLVAPAPSHLERTGAGWVGAGLIALAIGFVVIVRSAGPASAQDENAAIQGRVLDDKGVPVAGARVGLYRHGDRWAWSDTRIEEAQTGPDGSFRLKTPLQPIPPSPDRQEPRHLLLADHPGHAIGWRIIPDDAATFRDEIVLTEPNERTITVTDAEERPVEGATVTVYFLGDSSSPSANFRNRFQFRGMVGPLMAMSDHQGRATFRNLPRTSVSFVAVKPGYARTYASRERNTIRLTPSARLSGTVTGPDGALLKGVKIVLHADFMWSFEHAETDERGRFQFDGLRARGWDLSAWAPGQAGTGVHQVWIESDRFVMTQQTITLEPGDRQTLDIRAVPARVIHVTLGEEPTWKPVAGARIWGLGPGGRLDARTDEQGRATFRSPPGQVHLSVAGPPPGVYIEGDLRHHPGSSKTIEVDEDVIEINMSMPAIRGRLVSISGTCTRPDGSPAVGVTVHATAGLFQTSNSGYIRPVRTDDTGRFVLDGVPAGKTLGLYAESEDGKLGGFGATTTPDHSDPESRVSFTLRPTAKTTKTITDGQEKPLGSRKFSVTPVIEAQMFPLLGRIVESDAQGQIDLDRVVPGLAYRIAEEPRILGRGPGGGYRVERNPNAFNKDIVLVPGEAP